MFFCLPINIGGSEKNFTVYRCGQGKRQAAAWGEHLRLRTQRRLQPFPLEWLEPGTVLGTTPWLSAPSQIR